jgi:integrase
VTLRRDSSDEDFPLPRKPVRLPVILSLEEITTFFESIVSLRQRTILMSAYAAGLRVSEVAHLKVIDIDSRRMVIRVNQGKNRQDHYVMLSPRLLEILRTYWHDAHPRDWLFPGDIPDRPISRDAVALACRVARQRSGIRKPITLLNEARVTLAKALDGLKSFTYIYDYGDNWQHRIKVEKSTRARSGHAPAAVPGWAECMSAGGCWRSAGIC